MNDLNLTTGDLVRIVDYEVDDEVFMPNFGKLGLITGMDLDSGEPVYRVLVDDRSFHFYEDMLEKA